MNKIPYQNCSPGTIVPQQGSGSGTEDYLTDAEFVLGEPTMNLYRGDNNIEAISRPLAANFILSGLSVSLGSDPNARNISWAAGVYQIGERRVATAGGTKQLALGPIAGTDRRIDIIYMDANGVLQIVEGTPSTNPMPPQSSLPTDRFRNALVIGEVGVENGADGTGGYNLTVVNFETGGLIVPDATTTVKGIARLATQGEVDAGLSPDTIVTPATLAAYSVPLPDAPEFSLLYQQGTGTDDDWVETWDGVTGMSYDAGLRIFKGLGDAAALTLATGTPPYESAVFIEADGGTRSYISFLEQGNDWFVGAGGTKFNISEGGVTSRIELEFGGGTTLNDLAGVGSRMVVADASGLLSTQAIPTGIPLTGNTNDTFRWDGSSMVPTNQIQIPALGAPTIPALGGSGTRMVTTDNNGLVAAQSIPLGLPTAEQYTLAVNKGNTVTPNWEDTYESSTKYLTYNGASNWLKLGVDPSGTFEIATPVGSTGRILISAGGPSSEVSTTGDEGTLRMQSDANGRRLALGAGGTSQLIGIGPSSPTSGNPGDDMLFTDFVFKSNGRQQRKAYQTTSPVTGLITDEVQVLDTSSTAIDLTLPDVSSLRSVSDGHRITVRRSGANSATILPGGTDTIEGGASFLMNTDGLSVTLSYDTASADWQIISGYSGTNVQPGTSPGQLTVWNDAASMWEPESDVVFVRSLADLPAPTMSGDIRLENGKTYVIVGTVDIGANSLVRPTTGTSATRNNTVCGLGVGVSTLVASGTAIAYGAGNTLIVHDLTIDADQAFIAGNGTLVRFRDVRFIQAVDSVIDNNIAEISFTRCDFVSCADGVYVRGFTGLKSIVFDACRVVSPGTGFRFLRFEPNAVIDDRILITDCKFETTVATQSIIDYSNPPASMPQSGLVISTSQFIGSGIYLDGIDNQSDVVNFQGNDGIEDSVVGAYIKGESTTAVTVATAGDFYAANIDTAVTIENERLWRADGNNLFTYYGDTTKTFSVWASCSIAVAGGGTQELAVTLWKVPQGGTMTPGTPAAIATVGYIIGTAASADSISIPVNGIVQLAKDDSIEFRVSCLTTAGRDVTLRRFNLTVAN